MFRFILTGVLFLGLTACGSSTWLPPIQPHGCVNVQLVSIEQDASTCKLSNYCALYWSDDSISCVPCDDLWGYGNLQVGDYRRVCGLL